MYWKLLSKRTATGANATYHIPTALQNSEQIPADRLAYELSKNPEASENQNAAANLKGHCVFTAVLEIEVLRYGLGRPGTG